MGFISQTDQKPYINVMFGNFYSPGYDDEKFVDETMELIRKLGFNSVMFDTKAWEDFRERYETGVLSQYVKMQEYMGRSAHQHGLAYAFLLLYLNGDNLYPHIRFSPPIFGEETVLPDGTPGKWYKYWSQAARQSMKEHVDRIMESYGEGCERCRLDDGSLVVPVCSMWDPIVAPSFDREGCTRYRHFLRELYQGQVEKLNQAYELKAADFEELPPEEYWYSLKYGEEVFFTEEDVKQLSPKFMRWRDNALWKMQELTCYFREIAGMLKEKNPDLFLCPDLTQWGYFLNIYGRKAQDADNDFSQLWDTAMRGIDIYGLAPYVDACHFITVPCTPDGRANAYVVSCQHSMMRVMNPDRPMIGGIYFGRYIYQDLYRQLSPAEVIGSMAACGIDGYTCYGMNGLDDGGVLNRMEESFLSSLQQGNEWLRQVLPVRGRAKAKKVALLFPSQMAHLEPFEVGSNEIRRLDLLGWYELCSDLGYQADVISFHEVEKGALADYQVLILAANDCYEAVPHRETEERIRDFVRKGGILLHGPEDALAERCFGIQGVPCDKIPYRYGKVIIPQGEKFCRYEGGIPVADYVDGQGCCVMKYEGGQPAAGTETGVSADAEPGVSTDTEPGASVDAETAADMGAVYAFGVQIGASYAAKNIPHVPYEQNNKEMYPFIQAKTTLVADILYAAAEPDSEIRGRGIETGVFERGMIIVNHRPTPYQLPESYQTEYYQYFAGRTAEGKGILMPHSAVWVSNAPEGRIGE